ncbi:MAG: MFS transporter [Cyanobacteria bacterium SZAS LIN-3]|nr:MFS transporter [Cyanobacteria bacterium SZAS LIN-3]
MSSFSSQTTDSAKTAPELSARAVSLIFACGYLCQGVVQHFCLIAQPLNNYLKAGLHLDAAQVAFCVSLLMLPWVIKPIYGIVSDQRRFTRAGSKRKRFLIGIHLAAAAFYAALALFLFLLPAILPPGSLWPVLILIALAGVCIAFVTVIFVAMTVEQSHLDPGGSTRSFFGEQALAYSLANMAAVYCGGLLCAALPPARALAMGLVSAACVLLVASLFYARLLPASSATQPPLEPLAATDSETLLAKLKRLASSRAYVLTLLFLTLWNLSPSLGVSLYYFECDKLHFSQGTIGQLAACTSAGTLLGSLVFRITSGFFQKRRSTYLLIALSVATTLSYTALSTPLSGAVIEFCRGLITMVATLAIYGLAADVSPREVSATAMAVQIAVFNLAQEGSFALGGFLYARVFHKELLPLIVVSSLTTLLTAILVPYLGRSGCKQGDYREQVL